jgi:hypothetical protein
MPVAEPCPVRDMLYDCIRLLPTKRILQALFLALGVLSVGRSATASTWIAPSRQLTSTEKAALTVSQSDAIIVATVVDVRDSTFEGPSLIDDQPDSLRSSILYPYVDVTLKPLRWLKGAGGSEYVHVGMFREMDVVLNDISRDIRSGRSATGIYFLRRARRSWMISDYPGGYNRGHLTRVEPGELETPETRMITETIARQSLDSLIIRADLVAVGHWKLAVRSASGEPVAPDSLVIDEVLYGTSVDRAIVVTSPLASALDDTDPGVFFLRRVSAARYETLDFSAGAQRLLGDTLVRLGVRLGHVRARASALTTNPVQK